MNLRTVRATRYVTPLREGGSLPAIVEADDEGTYVLKFRGAGQGPKSLVAELVAGELARALGLPVPEIVFVELDPILGRTEPDPEIQDLLKASAGLNLGLDYLPGSITFDPLASRPAREDPLLASKIVWFDALTTNIDRTARNPNLLVWHRALWLIDHGASLYFHHSWEGFLDRARNPFAPIKDHVLLPFATKIRAADEELAPMLTPQVLASAVDLIPDDWLPSEEAFANVDEHRDAYSKYLRKRLDTSREWMEEAIRAHEARS
jgi:hypothetical protein